MTPKPRSDLSRLWRQYAPLIGAALTVLGFGLRAIRTYDAHVAEDVRRDERIRVLERITVSEHPDYSAMIYVDTRE